MKRLLMLAVLTLLAGCETLAPRVEGPADLGAWEARREWLQAIEHWKLEGRVAIAAYGEGWNASIDWIQEGEHMRVEFSGPLGVGSARIAGRPDQLHVRTADGEEFITTNPETDLYWQLGWTAPLDRMPFWIRGLPGPGEQPAIEVDAAGRPTRLEQGGWSVEYVDYLVIEGGKAMPRRIEMRRADVRIRLVASHWDLRDAKD